MSVLDRAALEDSPLADLHALASELGIDGFRRLRRDALIDAILAQQGSDGAAETDAAEAEAEAEETEEDEKRPRRAPRRRGGRGRSRRDADEAEAEVAEGTHCDDLPAAFPTQRFALDAEDPTLKAIEWLTPLGRGSRAVICGAAQSGKTETLRRLAGVLSRQEGLELTVVLAGVRPEEIAEWKASGPAEPAAALSFSASHDAQSQAVERAVETAKRIAARGGDAVVLLDTLDGLHPHAARKVLACARDIVDGGSLTIIATASKPHGGETTVIALDAELTSTRRFPALDLVRSGTLRAELLVGDAGADAI